MFLDFWPRLTGCDMRPLIERRKYGADMRYPRTGRLQRSTCGLNHRPLRAHPERQSAPGTAEGSQELVGLVVDEDCHPHFGGSGTTEKGELTLSVPLAVAVY
jgi:hypothetical protein